MPRPQLPDPDEELTPQALSRHIRDWARRVGYSFDERKATGHYAVVTVRDPAGGFTTTTIPKPHGGRKLPKYKVRYVVNQINSGWR